MAEKPKCPICQKPVVDKYKPFCSERCSLIDLGKWLGEGYKVKGPENSDEDTFLPKPDGDEELE